MKKLIPAFIFTIVCSSWAAHLHLEKWYQEKWCAGELEVVLEDGTRCDCVTDTEAIEFDFASKWAESLGQSLNYGRLTGKRPAIYLIMEKPDDEKHLKRLQDIIKVYSLPVRVWPIRK